MWENWIDDGVSLYNQFRNGNITMSLLLTQCAEVPVLAVVSTMFREEEYISTGMGLGLMGLHGEWVKRHPEDQHDPITTNACKMTHMIMTRPN